MDVERAIAEFLAYHISLRSGERRARLEKGLGYAELVFLRDVWWPVMQSFAFLHPEFEVGDYLGGSRFLDLAFLRGLVKLAIELDGYRIHGGGASRQRFSDDRRRQNMLVNDHWSIIRFSVDDLKEHPRTCRQTIQQFMGSRFGPVVADILENPSLAAIEREIIRIARAYPDLIAPRVVQEHLAISRNTSYRWLQQLAGKGWLVPVTESRGTRIAGYRLADRATRLGI